MSTQKNVTIVLKPGATMVYLRNPGGQTFKIIHPDGQLDVTTVLERATTSGTVQTYTVERATEKVTITAPAGAQFDIVWDNGRLSVGSGSQTPTLGAITASIVANTETSQRVAFTTTPNATNYHARRFTDAGHTQLAEQKDIAAGGNTYADFTGLPSNTHFYYNVLPQANGYNSPAPATTDAATPAPSTPTLNAPVLSLSPGRTRQRLAIGAVANAANYHARRFTDAGRTQLAEQRDVASSSNAFADFTPLIPNTHYYYDVVPQATGYNSPAPSITDGSTLNTVDVYLMGYDTPVVPVESDFEQWPDYTLTDQTQAIAISVSRYAGKPQYLTLAFLDFVPTHWQEENNPINNGPIGNGETFKVIASIPATVPGRNTGFGLTWTVVQSDKTDFANRVIFS